MSSHKILDKNLVTNCLFSINQWYGRFGNNVLQAANCLSMAEIFEGKSRSSIRHPLIRTFEASFTNKSPDKAITEKFFCDDDSSDIVESYVLDDCAKGRWESLLVKNVKMILSEALTVKLRKDPIDEQILVVHLRGEDVFKSHAPIYTQNPLSHILTVSKDFKEVWVVHQDNVNPIVQELKKEEKYKFFSRDLVSDFEILYRSKSLLIGGCSTFSEVAAIGSPHKKQVWTSDACRFVDHIKKDNDVIHLKLNEHYCGGRRNWTGDVDQMMTYQVSEADYTRYTGASK